MMFIGNGAGVVVVVVVTGGAKMLKGNAKVVIAATVIGTRAAVVMAMNIGGDCGVLT